MPATPKHVHNEQIKLRASLLNAFAVSTSTVWVIAPLAAAIYTPATGVVVKLLLVGVPSAFAAATVFHLLAQRVLRGLRE